MDETEYQQSLKAFKDLSSAFFPPSVVLCAIELELFTTLETGPMTAESLAGKLSLDSPALEKLLTGLVSLGYLECEGLLFRNTPFASRALVRGKKDYEGDSALMSLWFMRQMVELSEIVRHGHGPETFEDEVSDSSGRARQLTHAMDQISRQYTTELVENIDMNGVRRILDVAGAAGSFAMALVKGHDDVQATVLELPHVAAQAKELIAQRGMLDRVEVREGDFRQDPLGEDYDLVFCSNIFHLCDPQLCSTLVNKAAAALNPGGKLVIKDMIPETDKPMPQHMAMFSTLMPAISHGGQLHDEAAYTRWCIAAGLEEPERIDCWERSSLLIARKPL
jgi:cyclopropane fatty-acyl-phospholipid synthase-like methyltransferase